MNEILETKAIENKIYNIRGVEVMLDSDLAEIYKTTQQNISQHINSIYKDNELELNSTNKKFLLVQKEGRRDVKRNIEHYNLDAIIAVGYRINSKKATEFRIWATKVLKEYLITGVVMDDERLKNPEYIFGEDYFERTLERIRNIRSSERRFYQKITDIYATSIDYDRRSPVTIKFFKKVLAFYFLFCYYISCAYEKRHGSTQQQGGATDG